MRFLRAIRYGAEYVLVLSFLAAVRILPFRAGMALARGVGRLIRRIDKRHVARAMENLRAAFPEKSDAELQSLVTRVYENLVESGIEAVHALSRVRPENLGEHVFLDESVLDLKTLSGSGIIFVTGHMGSWEVLGALSGLIGYPLWSLARPLDNPLLDRFVVRHREKMGQRVLARKGAMLEAMRVLRSGGYVAFLVDQDARRPGVFVPFFGRPASTVTSVARLARATGCPVVFAWARRDRPGLHFHVHVAGPVRADPSLSEDEDIYRITATYTAWLEAAVREYPDRWLWLHRRWKTVPSPERMAEYERRRTGGTGGEWSQNPGP